MDREALTTERNNMMQLLKQTDYIALKIAEGAATPAEYTEEFPSEGYMPHANQRDRCSARICLTAKIGYLREF